MLGLALFSDKTSAVLFGVGANSSASHGMINFFLTRHSIYITDNPFRAGNRQGTLR